MPTNRFAEGVPERWAGSDSIPSITNPNWLVLRKRRELIIALAGADSRGKTCAFWMWADEFSHTVRYFGTRVRQYVAIDVVPTPLVDVIAQG